MIALPQSAAQRLDQRVGLTFSRLLAASQKQDRQRHVVRLIRLAGEGCHDLAGLADLASLASNTVFQQSQPGQCRHAQRMLVLSWLVPFASIRLRFFEKLDALRESPARSPDRPARCPGLEPDRSGRGRQKRLPMLAAIMG